MKISTQVIGLINRDLANIFNQVVDKPQFDKIVDLLDAYNLHVTFPDVLGASLSARIDGEAKLVLDGVDDKSDDCDNSYLVLEWAFTKDSKFYWVLLSVI